jgi:transforming growth factor-beta-induced protein
MERFIVAYLFLVLAGSCAASYLRETTPAARQLRTSGGPILDDIILTDTDLTTLAAAFKAADLVGKLSTSFNYTLFAPNNDAFAAVDQSFLATLLTPSWILHLQNLLAFHVTLPTEDGNRLLSTDYVDGQIFEMLNSEQVSATVLKRGISLSSPLTNNSMIVEADLLATNGALQKIDAVFSPGYFGIDVFSLGESYFEFTILQELMDILGLVGTKGEFTILAPTNEAFLALGNATLAALKKDTKALGKILANHVIVGVFPSIFLEDGVILPALGGLDITVTISEAAARQTATTIMFNDANTIIADILAINGIVHAIDMVLLDDDDNDSPSAIPSGSPSASPSDSPF